MKGSIRATVKIGTLPQKEKRFAPNTPARVIKAWKIAMRAKLLKRAPKAVERDYRRDTLAGDAPRYYALIKHLSSFGASRRKEIRAWFPYLGNVHRHMITKADVLKVRGIWLEKGTETTKRPLAAKTINNRITALRDLYHVLDGEDAPTPCDGIKQLPPAKVPPQIVSAATVNAVLEKLAERAIKNGRGRPCRHALEDRARLMVLASTGKRPCELERAQPGDVDLRRRVWVTRDAKGGFSPGIYLNDEMILAWEAFIEAEAWGTIPGHFSRRLHAAGWPTDVRPYNLRHSTWIEASERGIDLADIQAGAGHRKIATTRIHYVPVIASRMQKMSEALAGRFGWKPGVENLADGRA